MCSTLSRSVEYMTLADSDCVLWLDLIEVGEGKNFTFNYFSISGYSKQKKIHHKKVVVWPQLGRERGRPLCGGHHPKLPLSVLSLPLAGGKQSEGINSLKRCPVSKNETE